MKVTWEVDDGYVGKSAPQHTIIDESYFEDMTEEEIQMEIDEWVSNDFHERISYHITHIDGRKV